MCLTHYDEKLHERTLLREGREEGFSEGREAGLAEGILNSLRSLIETMKLSPQQAMDALKIPAAQQEKYSKLLNLQ